MTQPDTRPTAAEAVRVPSTDVTVDLRHAKAREAELPDGLQGMYYLG